MFLLQPKGGGGGDAAWASFTMNTVWFGLVVINTLDFFLSVFLFAFLFADPVQGARVEQPPNLHVPHHRSHTLRG
jgi:hypothetical protein